MKQRRWKAPPCQRREEEACVCVSSALSSQFPIHTAVCFGA